jgi:hypothetical protein
MLGLDDYIMLAINRFLESKVGMCLQTTWLYDVLEITWQHLANDKLRHMEEREVAELARVRKDMQRKIDYYECAAQDRKTVPPWREPGTRIYGLRPMLFFEVMFVVALVGILAGLLTALEALGFYITPRFLDRLIATVAVGLFVALLALVLRAPAEGGR